MIVCVVIVIVVRFELYLWLSVKVGMFCGRLLVNIVMWLVLFFCVFYWLLMF